MKKIIKKAFTLVELLVVIAILACLSTIGIIGFNAFKNKGKNAADTSTVATLNRYTQSYTVNETIHYPTKLGTILKEHGLDIFKLQAEQEGYRFGFDLNGKKFVLIDNEDNLVDSNASKLNVFAFVNNNTDLTRLVAAGYSIFAQDGEFDAAISTSTGFDSGLNEEFTAVNYTHSGEEQFATIYTNTCGTKLNVAASNDTVYHYGYSGLVTVSAVATASYDEYGTVGRLVNETDSSTGHIAIKSGAIVYQIVEASGDDYFVTVEAGATVYDDQGTKLSGTVDTRVEGVNDDKFDEDAPTTCEHAHTHIFSDGQYLYETCDTCGYTVLTVGSAKKSVSDGTNNTILQL